MGFSSQLLVEHDNNKGKDLEDNAQDLLNVSCIFCLILMFCFMGMFLLLAGSYRSEPGQTEKFRIPCVSYVITIISFYQILLTLLNRVYRH